MFYIRYKSIELLTDKVLSFIKNNYRKNKTFLHFKYVINEFYHFIIFLLSFMLFCGS